MPSTGVFHTVPGMSWLSKAVKKAARSKILRGAASAAAGVLLPAVATRGLSIAKSLGGKIIGNRHATNDSKSVKAAVAKLANMVPPSVVDGARNPTKPAVIEAWPKKTRGSSTRRSTKPKRKRAGGRKASREAFAEGTLKAPKGFKYDSSKATGGDQSHRDEWNRQVRAARAKKKPTGKGSKSGSSSGKRAAPFKSGNSNAAAMKAASASWKKMTDAQKKAAGGWRGHVSKTLGGK